MTDSREFRQTRTARQQLEGPGKDCFRISDVFETPLILILAQISSISAKVLLLQLLYLRKSDHGNFSKMMPTSSQQPKNEAIDVARE